MGKLVLQQKILVIALYSLTSITTRTYFGIGGIDNASIDNGVGFWVWWGDVIPEL